MNITVTDISELISLDEHDVCSAEHLAEISGLTVEEIDALVDAGVVVPVDERAVPMTFQLQCVVTVNLARRLRDDFELDRNGMALALTLMRRVDALEAELRAARALINRNAPGHD